MAKIYIASVSNDEATYSVLTVLTEEQVVEGTPTEVPIGEATLTFPKDAPMETMKKAIIKAAQGIQDAHKDAKDKKQDLTGVDWPDII